MSRTFRMPRIPGFTPIKPFKIKGIKKVSNKIRKLKRSYR